MPSKVDRLAKLPGSKTTKQKKDVEISGLNDVVAQLGQMSDSNRELQIALIKQLQQLSQIILTASKQGSDMSGVETALERLIDKIDRPRGAPMEYQIDFERDRNHLMKPGIRLRPVRSKLN